MGCGKHLLYLLATRPFAKPWAFPWALRAPLPLRLRCACMLSTGLLRCIPKWWCTTCYGFRYIDDLLLFLKENSNLIGGIYPPPLQLEEEAGIELADGSYEFRFLETWTRLTPDGRLDISHHHKNTHRASRGQAQVKNVAHFSSHVPPHQKFGRVVGALTSAWSHSVGHPNKVKAAA